MRALKWERGSWRAWAVAAALVAVTLLAFSQAAGLRFVDYDDPLYVTENIRVKGGLTLKGVAWAFSSFRAANWHPLTWLSHMLDVSLWGMAPAGHHLVSLAVHVANALLLFWVLLEMTDALWPSVLTAALFAVHPLHVESVAWVAERKDVLSAFFGLLCVRSYHLYVRGPSRLRRAWVFLWLALSLMAKPMLVTLPCVLLLLDFWPLERFESLRGGARLAPRAFAADLFRLLPEKAPLFALALASSIVTFVAQWREGATVGLEPIPFWARLANVFVSYATYLGKTLWPSNLAVFYPHPAKTVSLWGAAGGLFLVVLLTVGALRWARARPYLAVGWFWFVGTLVPVIGLVQVGSQALADRYTYWPLIGLFLAVSWAAGDVAVKWRRSTVALALVAIAVLSGLVVVTREQTRHWKTGITLFEHAIKVTRPDNRLARVALGSALVQQGRLEEGEAYYREALTLKQDDPIALTGMGTALLRQGRLNEAIKYYSDAIWVSPYLALGHHGLGAALFGVKGRLDESIKHSEMALALDPESLLTKLNLAMAYERKGDSKRAIAQYREALRAGLEDERLYKNFGALLVREGRFSEGIANYREALRLAPSDWDVRLRLGTVLARRGAVDEGVDHLREAVRLRPDSAEAHYNLGVALDQLGRAGEAEVQLREALKIDPSDAMTLGNLGMILGRAGRLDDAIAYLRQAVALRPDSGRAHNDLGMALWSRGQIAEARRHFREAVRLLPGDPDVERNLRAVVDDESGSSLRSRR